MMRSSTSVKVMGAMLLSKATRKRSSMSARADSWARSSELSRIVADHPVAPVEVQGRQGEVDRQLAGVLAQDRQVLVAPDDPQVRVVAPLAPGLVLDAAQAWRDEDGDVLARELGALVAGHGEQGLVDVGDGAVLVEQGRAVGQGLEEQVPREGVLVEVGEGVVGAHDTHWPVRGALGRYGPIRHISHRKKVPTVGMPEGQRTANGRPTLSHEAYRMLRSLGVVRWRWLLLGGRSLGGSHLDGETGALRVHAVETCVVDL